MVNDINSQWGKKLKVIQFARLAAIAAAVPLVLSSMAYAETSSAASVQPQVQPTKPAASKQAAPARAPKKVPNFAGVWEIYPDPFGGVEDTLIELEAPNGGPKLREPYASQWKGRIDKRNAALKAGAPIADRATLCLPEGLPGIMGAIFPIQILQTPNEIVILAEFLAQTRRIKLDKKMPPVEEVTPSFYGYSVGRWEGKTLVVETLGVREDTEYFEIPHSSEMKITERIRVTKPGYIENDIVIEDPKVMLEPYRFTYGYKRNNDYEMTEYICEKEDPLWKVNSDGTVEMKAGGAANDKDAQKPPGEAPKAPR